MDKLYYVKYSQESEAYVKASSSQEAVDYITELTENGGGTNMNSVRLNECGWYVEEELGELKKLDEDTADYHTHEAGGHNFAEGDFGLYWD